jgi:hypothetical protein
VDGSVYPNLHAAVNGLSDSLFSIEKMKDDRLGTPLGLHTACTKVNCPDKSEHPYSGIAFQAQAETLKFYTKVFMGGDGFGFDDLLTAKGHPEVITEVQTVLARALSAIEIVKTRGTFIEQIGKLDMNACKASTSDDRKEELCAYQKDIRDLTLLIRTDFILSLDLAAPAGYQGDND